SRPSCRSRARSSTNSSVTTARSRARRNAERCANPTARRTTCLPATTQSGQARGNHRVYPSDRNSARRSRCSRSSTPTWSSPRSFGGWRYVADRFREIGLEPLGDNGTFFQHFTMPIVDLTEMSTLTGAGGKTYRPRVDFTESVGGRSGSGKAEAEIAAVGGAARSGGLNDFAGANARGKI